MYLGVRYGGARVPADTLAVKRASSEGVKCAFSRAVGPVGMGEVRERSSAPRERWVRLWVVVRWALNMDLPAHGGPRRNMMSAPGVGGDS